MVYWKVTDKILTGTINFWKCTFLKFIFSGLNSKVLFIDLCVRWSFLMNVFSHFPNFIFPTEVFSYAIRYLLKEAFTKLRYSQAMQWFLS